MKFVADNQPAEPVQPGEQPLHHPAAHHAAQWWMQRNFASSCTGRGAVLPAGEEVNPANRVEPLRIRGSTEFFSGRFEDAQRHLTELRNLSPGPVSDWYLAQAMYYVGDHSGAEVMLANLHGSAQAERRAQATLAGFLAAGGEKHRARALLSDVVNGGYMDHHVAYSLGAAYAQVAEPIEARRWLARAVNTGFPCYPWFERDPMLNPLRNDPEFQHLMAELRKSSDSAKSRYGAHHTFLAKFRTSVRTV